MSQETRTPYSREAEHLLDQIADRALDDDYYLVRQGRYSRSRGINTLGTATVVAMLAVLVTIAAVQAYQERPGQQAARDALQTDIAERRAQQDSLEEQAAALELEVSQLQGEPGWSDQERSLALVTGAGRVAGDGIVVTIDPTVGSEVTDAQLRGLLNELWLAGAEAVAVNGQRLGALSSIRSVDGVVTVNFRSIGAPFVVRAIGDAVSIRERLESSGESAYWQRRQGQGELGFDLAEAEDQHLPAAPAHRTSVTHATPVGGAS